MIFGWVGRNESWIRIQLTEENLESRFQFCVIPERFQNRFEFRIPRTEINQSTIYECFLNESTQITCVELYVLSFLSFLSLMSLLSLMSFFILCEAQCLEAHYLEA